MKKIYILLVFLFAFKGFSQDNRTLTLTEDKNLIEVTYFHDNGTISQTGYYTLDGKLHGNWFSYCTEGNKIVSAKYDQGIKTGTWFYWNEDVLNQVDYSSNAIVQVNTWNKETLANN